ncbi:hypothetical protein RRG08_065916, partial [Elysia crispata]
MRIARFVQDADVESQNQRLVNSCGGAYEGCFEETVRRRHFSISPGDFSPEIATTMTCRMACGVFDFKYAALAQ